MTNIEKFNRFIDERIELASSVQTMSAYTVVKETFNSLFNKDEKSDNEPIKLTHAEIHAVIASMRTQKFMEEYIERVEAKLKKLNT